MTTEQTIDEQERGIPSDRDEREAPVPDRPEPEAPAVTEPFSDDVDDERHDRSPLRT
jgi:hypothetical protein